jgi:hypothetical protein
MTTASSERRMTQVLSVILAFVLTGLIGNRLLQLWQHRGWLRQQQFLGQEKEYTALRELSTELSGAISKRLYQMQRLLWAVRSLPDDVMEQRLKDYDATLTLWNESLSTYFVRLTLYASYYDTVDLERRIHEPFQRVGARLEAMVKSRRRQQPLSRSETVSLENQLNDLQGVSFQFNRDLLRVVENKRTIIYFGDSMDYSRSNIGKFSTWQLIKALFVSDVDAHTVARSSLDS